MVDDETGKTGEPTNAAASDADRIAALERRIEALENPTAAAAPAPAAPVQDADAPAAQGDTKIDRIVEAAREETERGRKARRQ